MNIESRVVYICPDELSKTNVFEVRQELCGLFEAGYRSLVINLDLVSRFDAVGLSVLLSARKMARLHGAQVSLAAPRVKLRKALEQFGLSQTFPIYCSAELAAPATDGQIAA